MKKKPNKKVPKAGDPRIPERYLVIFKMEGTNPHPCMEEGWLSISILAGSKEEAERWGQHRATKLGPWLKCYLELVQTEIHRPRPEMAGPYRGLILGMD